MSKKNKFETGDKVELAESALTVSYISHRANYTNMYAGKIGTVIGYSETGKVAVEFDTIVFTDYKEKLSRHDNGCHGRGKLHYCWYIPEEHLKVPMQSLHNFGRAIDIHTTDKSELSLDISEDCIIGCMDFEKALNYKDLAGNSNVTVINSGAGILAALETRKKVPNKRRVLLK